MELKELKTLKEFLNAQNIKYDTIRHGLTYGARATAASAHIPREAMAKTVIVKIDRSMAMAVVPACYDVDLNLLQKMVGTGEVRLANEKEFNDRFTDCEAGAMPPFGNLYGMDVYVDKSLSEAWEISFNAGSHHELIKMAYSDFERLVRPEVGEFSSERNLVF